MTSKYPVITHIIQTCSACPSQWEGKFADGDWLYIRYRWGGLSIHKGNPDENQYNSIAATPIIFSKQIGETGWEGVIELDDVLLESGLELAENVVWMDKERDEGF